MHTERLSLAFSDERITIRHSVICCRLPGVLAHPLNEVVHVLKAPLYWLRNGKDALPACGISLEPRLCCRPSAVHTVDFDAVARRRDMEVPANTLE